MEKICSIEELESARERIREARDPNRLRITVCGGTGCLATGSAEVADELRRQIAERDLTEKVDLKMSGCHGPCWHRP